MRIKTSSTLKYVLGLGLLISSSHALAEDPILMNEVAGEVSANNGENFQPSNVGDEVFENSQILVGEGSTAQLKYPNGCLYDVVGEYLLVVPAEAPCKAGALFASTAATAGLSTGTQTAIVLGSMAVIASSTDTKKTISP